MFRQREADHYESVGRRPPPPPGPRAGFFGPTSATIAALAFHMRIPFTAVSTLFCKTDPNYGLRRFSFLGLHTQ